MKPPSSTSRRRALATGLALLAGSPLALAEKPEKPASQTASAALSDTPQLAAKSVKRGIAYDLANSPDLKALSPGVSWWYDWGLKPNPGAPAAYRKKFDMDFYSMLWNDVYDHNTVVAWLKAHPKIKFLLVLNEPNLVEQSNKTPQQAAAFWPGYERIATETGVKIVGPQITWGTMSPYNDPVAWLDAFYAAYRSANGGRDPRIDYLGFHWYDYGLSGQLDRLTKYGKPFWVTEFANWHSQADGAQIDTLEKQKAQMTDMVSVCEQRTDVFRYAWFTGRWNPDPHFTSLLASPGTGQLTELGRHYLSLPFTKARPLAVEASQVETAPKSVGD